MKSKRVLFGAASILMACLGLIASAPAAAPSSGGLPAAVVDSLPQMPGNTRGQGPLGLLSPAGDWKKNWTADNGNGTYSNPLFYEEFEDPDPIRVGDTYYLAGTTMHMNPAVQLMESKDLVNWKLAGYCGDKLDLGPAYRLENGNVYGKGIWAPCLRYHKDMFYVFCNVNGAGLLVYRSASIYGPWERNQLPGKHDMSVLFDDDLNKVFLIYGGNAPYMIDELAPDLRSVAVPNAHRMNPQGAAMGEGHHLYKIKGKYYDVSARPGGPVNQVVAKADSIDGPWTSTLMVDHESLGVPSGAPARAAANNGGLWLHQGGMCDTPSGQWWSVIMSDHGNGGRMVSLVPITWEDEFPLIGLPGNLRRAPNTWLKPDTGFKQDPTPANVRDDNFDAKHLNPNWQWNHVEDDTQWSLTENPGKLRLHSLAAQNLYAARNTLCTRPPGPECQMTVEIDAAGMKEGDNAGLGVIQSPCASIGFVKTAEGLVLQETSVNVGGGGRGRGAGGGAGPAVVKGPDNPPTHVWLRLHADFDTEQVQYSYSLDGKQFTALGPVFPPSFSTGTTFQGMRPGLYCFNSAGSPGGSADFDNFTVEEPRARGIEREIPAGKTIVLTSGADGSYLAADPANNRLVNLAALADGAIPANAKFKVIDLGLGRVELQAADGRVVSVSAPDNVALKLQGDAKATDAESFQWVNLMRGDTMLMTLTNHQYLATKPANPGPVTATALGASPARKSGAEFKWKAVD